MTGDHRLVAETLVVEPSTDGSWDIPAVRPMYIRDREDGTFAALVRLNTDVPNTSSGKTELRRVEISLIDLPKPWHWINAWGDGWIEFVVARARQRPMGSSDLWRIG